MEFSEEKEMYRSKYENLLMQINVFKKNAEA